MIDLTLTHQLHEGVYDFSILEDGVLVYEFAETTYDYMLYTLHTAVVHTGRAPTQLRVLMGPLYQHHELTPAEVALLHTDWRKLLEAWSPQSRVVVMRPPTLPVAQRLLCGHETLCRGFGEQVYVRRRGELVESPFTGRWVDVSKKYTVVSALWATIALEELRGCARYYLPRDWNTPGPWISDENLEQRRQALQQAQESFPCPKST